MSKNSEINNKKELSPEQRNELLVTLKARFEKNMSLHSDIEWANVETKLEAHPQKLWSLHEMERTGGEPDVAMHDHETGEYIFTIVSWKVLKGVEVSVMTVKHWNPESSTSRKIASWIW